MYKLKKKKMKAVKRANAILFATARTVLIYGACVCDVIRIMTTTINQLTNIEVQGVI